MELSLLINKFNLKGRLVALEPFGNGNINDTFLAVYRNTFTETQVVLQRVNRSVFTQPEAIMRNMHNITLHCHEKLEADAKTDRDDRVWQMPRIVRTKEGADFVTDENGDVWRVITRILSAHAGLAWKSGGHTALPTMTTAEGPGSEILEGMTDNTEIGEGKVIVTGIATSGYTGTVEVPFSIVEKDENKSVEMELLYSGVVRVELI